MATNKEIEQKNKEIALMLGLIPCDKPYDGAFITNDKTYKPSFFINQMEGESWYIYPKFNSDWNWLMTAVEFIENLGKDVEILTSCDMENQKTYTCAIYYQSKFNETINHTNKQQAVFNAVSEFALLYNQNKL